MQEALAQDSVPPPLKPYTENKHRYYLFTGTSCTGLSDDNESLLEDERAQPLTDSSPSACNSAMPNSDDFSAYSKIILQHIHVRGRTPCSFRDTQVPDVGTRTLAHLPTVTAPTPDEDAFQDAENDDF